MKKNLTKIAALLLVLSMIFAFAACKGEDDGEDSTAPSESSAYADNTAASNDEGEPSETSSDDASEVDSTEGETATDASGKVVAEKPADSGKAPVVTAAGNQAPSSTADILKYYNAATKAAVTGKVGFTKHRETNNEKIDANAVVKQFKTLIYKFMGIGSENAYNETVTKGQWDSDARKQYLRTSTLSTSDVTAATCKESGSNYIITINIKNGNSYATKGTATCNAPLDKCGICVGDEDKGYYDHKRASCIYDAIEDVYGNAKVTESYSGAVVTATVDAATGHFIKLDVKFNLSVTIDLGVAGTPTATGTTYVSYSNFKY
ncbi:MAG: hypothetical protein ACI4I0_06775 [Acutalibacteraceae bacterium]